MFKKILILFAFIASASSLNGMINSNNKITLPSIKTIKTKKRPGDELSGPDFRRKLEKKEIEEKNKLFYARAQAVQDQIELEKIIINKKREQFIRTAINNYDSKNLNVLAHASHLIDLKERHDYYEKFLHESKYNNNKSDKDFEKIICAIQLCNYYESEIKKSPIKHHLGKPYCYELL